MLVEIHGKLQLCTARVRLYPPVGEIEVVVEFRAGRTPDGRILLYRPGVGKEYFRGPFIR